MKVKVAVPFLRIFTKSFWTKEKFLIVDFSIINILYIFNFRLIRSYHATQVEIEKSVQNQQIIDFLTFFQYLEKRIHQLVHHENNLKSNLISIQIEDFAEKILRSDFAINSENIKCQTVFGKTAFYKNHVSFSSIYFNKYFKRGVLHKTEKGKEVSTQKFDFFSELALETKPGS